MCVDSSICAEGNLVYLFGGADVRDVTRQTNSIISFDIIRDTWETLFAHTDEYDENKPPPIYNSLLLCFNGFLYVLAGNSLFENLEGMYKFCLTLKWSSVPQNCVKPNFNRPTYGTVYKNQ
ncbi:hypothetical protein RF11_09169 [Thelohanellus kitauei]|uniref:Kelch domain-containing protein 10 n=1 Tax=Thelohanellus kitauei TaxID=669202 RepID=A0A0C2N4B2_THEKT|nr:hypothetical protein RF11_09169 [Thelohanellus kitauei]